MNFPMFNSVVIPDLDKIRAQVRKDCNKANYNTYKKAIDEIGRLQDEVSKLESEIALLKSKPKKGRPRKNLNSNGSVITNLMFSMKADKKGGRSPKISIQEMNEILEIWDSVRVATAKKNGRKSYSDKEFLHLTSGKDISELTVRERAEIKFLHDKLGYYRDRTGKRIRTRRKLKTPYKKT